MKKSNICSLGGRSVKSVLQIDVTVICIVFALVCGRYSCDDAWQGPGEDGRTTIELVVPPGDEASENQFALLGTL